jgi:hypothetical protein
MSKITAEMTRQKPRDENAGPRDATVSACESRLGAAPQASGTRSVDEEEIIENVQGRIGR